MPRLPWKKSPDESFEQLACLSYDQRGPDPSDRIEAARQMLVADPTVASASVAALAAVGDAAGLAQRLEGDAVAVNQESGQRSWAPILYCTYSRVDPVADTDWSSVETLKVLIDHGANPNDGFLWQGNLPPFTALTGVIGGGERHQSRHQNWAEMARCLLEAGADANDGQALYNNGLGGAGHDDPSYLALLLEFGLGTATNGPWYAKYSDALREPGELLYDELEAACLRNRPKVLGLLIEQDLDLTRVAGRYGMTPFRAAARYDHVEVLALLRAAGVSE